MWFLPIFLLIIAPKATLSVMTDMKDYTEKILSIYQTPISGTTSQLLMYAYFYLDEMYKLEECVEEGKEDCKNFLKKFYEEGGPQHLDSIPWTNFQKELEWKGHDISEYEQVINRTKKSWTDLLKLLEELTHSGQVK